MYKRQTLIYVASPGLLQVVYQAIRRYPDYMRPVSYTHLDVYKRQEKSAGRQANQGNCRCEHGSPGGSRVLQTYVWAGRTGGGAAVSLSLIHI